MGLDQVLRRVAQQGPDKPWSAFLRAALCVAVVLVFRVALSPVLGGASGSILFGPAVLIASVWGGWRSGVWATGLAILAGAAAAFIPGALAQDWMRFWIATGLSFINNVVCIVLGDALRKALQGIERARAQERADNDRLVESETRFRSIAESAPVLIWVTNADRTRAFINQAYAEFVGGDYASALTTEWRDRLHPDDHDRIVAESIAGEATGKPFMLEGRYSREDGDYRWLRSYSRPRYEADGALGGFVGMAYDVSDAKQAERDLTHINELLEARVAQALDEKERAEAALMHAQKMEAVGRLTGGVAHDFNNLLTVVIGALDMVSRNPDDARRRDKLIDAALQAARRGEQLTHQLLTFSRRQTLRPQLADPNGLLVDGEPLLRRAVGEAVSLTLRLCDAPPAVSLDPAHFEAAIMNLVVNARDATPDGGEVVISTERVFLRDGEVGGASSGDYLKLTVRDTGSGMSTDVRDRAFEPFFTTKPVGKGTGLGLSQVYGFVRQSGGAMDIDSAPGEGTAISLYLPAMAEEAPVMPPRPEPTPDDGARPFAGRTVLLVEDDAQVSEIAAAVLEEMGMAVTRAVDGRAALAAIAGRSFDLLLTDIVMPGGMSGVDVARRVTDQRPEIAVLMASGYAGEALERVTADAPWPLLPKPYDAAEMRRAIEGVLDR